uniref:Uncharacterized protein n=1 Tax=Candidatus Methanophaga sp. ANME-1 ERB7 TaxID=2759913 RepID=A0A7G9Z8Z5_9EURY|nr:hypothetical protein HGIILDEE_00018 [Methanosarcinales archaeon ANME-1 ERB7]
MGRGIKRLVLGLIILTVVAIYAFVPLAFAPPACDNLNLNSSVSQDTNIIDTETTKMVNASASWKKGDFNYNGIPADVGDLAMMVDVAVGKLIPDCKYDLNDNGIFADAGDLAMMKDASVGKIELL